VAKHSLDIVAFKSVSAPLIPLTALVIIGGIVRGELNYGSIIAIPFAVLVFSIPYYIISGIGWVTWGFLTVLLAKRYIEYVPLPISIIISALLFFVLLSITLGFSAAALLSVVAFIQAVAFIWFYLVNENS